MTISVGDYVKVIYEFEGEAATDLPLKVDDVVVVTDVPDKNWFTGELVWDKNSSGNFPSAFVESLTLPSVLTGQKVFLAIEDFPAEQAGDLDFVKGDVIIGLESMNGGWWKGKNGPLKGIFPLTYVTELSVESGPRSRSASARSNSIISGGGESFDGSDVNRAINDLLTQKKTVYARALVDIKPQLDGELAFQLGDIIELTDAIDDDWFYGRCHNKEGLVSSVCVEFIDAVDDSGFQEDIKPQHDQSKTEPGYQAGSNDPKSRTFSNDSYNSENTRSHDAEISAYGRVLFPFSAQLSNELSLCESQLVNLIQHVDSDWTEGEVDGKRGIFPTSFVEIIVDCPFADNCSLSEKIDTSPFVKNSNSNNDWDREGILSSGQRENQVSEKASGAVKPVDSEEAESHEIGLVVHTFMAEVSQDITVSEGETVEVLRHADDNWLEVKTDTGLKGLVPRNHIDIIGPWPPSSSRSEMPPALPARTSNGPCSSIKDGVRTDNHKTKTQPTGESNMHFRPGILLAAQEQTTVPIPDTTTGKPTIKPKPSIGKKPSLPSKPALIKPILSLKPPNSNKVASVPASPTSPQTDFNTQKMEEKSLYTSLKSGQTKNLTNVLGPFTEQKALLDRSPPSSLRKKEPLKNMKDISSSTNSKSFSEKVSPLVSPEIRRRSASTAEQEMFNASKLSQPKPYEEKSAFVNRAFQIEIDEGFLIDVKQDKPSPPRRPPPRNASPRPHSAMVGPDLLSQETQTKLRAPPPRPTGPRIAPAPGKAVLVPIKVDPQPKIIPKRPAPKAPPLPPKPCMTTSDSGQESRAYPQPPRRPPPPPVSFPPPPVVLNIEDLMSFSPGEFDTDPASPELVMDIKTKLEENQKDIKRYEESRKEILEKLQIAGGQEDEREARENLEFVDYTLSGLKEEEKNLKENLFLLVPHEARLEKARLLAAQHAAQNAEEEEKRKEEERRRAVELRERRKEQRGKVIAEIIETEKDYLMSLQLCLETFLEGQKPPAHVDVEFLLGNMEEIADVSQKVLATLESSIAGKNFEEQMIGKCFIHFADDMKNTYAPYCRNHDEVIQALERYEGNPDVNEYFANRLEKMKEQMNVFDIAGVLIKPVQRILKYPLLLNELLKNTEESHEDKAAIETAIREMTDVAKAINEYKRRKDLVYKYKKSSDQTFSDKISKLNFHSIKKKSTRIRGRLSTNFGIALLMRDETFEAEETKFRNLEKAVKIFLRSVMQFLENSQEAMGCQEMVVNDITQFYAGRESVEARKLQVVVTKLLDLYDKMKENIDNTVVVPLKTLVSLFNAPSHVIEKRFDKLLDYNSQLGKAENDKELQVAKNDYEAMNAQLLDELPKFYSHAFNMLKHCISAFVLARRDFMDQSLKESCVLLELPSMQSKTSTIETFNIRHTTAFDQMSLLSFIPRGYNPRVDTIKADKAKLKGKMPLDNGTPYVQQNLAPSCGSQSDTQRQQLQQKYGSDKLFTVISTYNGTDIMDISLTEGSLVGVVKELDPMGNKERWFVDDGVNKGFIPCNVLSPYKPSPCSSVNSTSVEDDILSIQSYDSGENIVLSGNDGRASYHISGSNYEQQQTEYQYYALYDFHARHPNEASLKAGHPVTVLAFKDLEGNAEWWLVDADDQRGYAPANYMAPMPLS